MTLTEAAHHEAGHAVAAFALGLELGGLTVVPGVTFKHSVKPSGLGNLSHEQLREIGAAVAKSVEQGDRGALEQAAARFGLTIDVGESIATMPPFSVLDFCAVLLAGVCCDVRINPAGEVSPCGDDDLENVRMALGVDSLTEEVIGPPMRRALEVLSPRCHLVDRLASELEGRKTLTWDEALRILEAP